MNVLEALRLGLSYSSSAITTELGVRRELASRCGIAPGYPAKVEVGCRELVEVEPVQDVRGLPGVRIAVWPEKPSAELSLCEALRLAGHLIAAAIEAKLVSEGKQP